MRLIDADVLLKQFEERLSELLIENDIIPIPDKIVELSLCIDSVKKQPTIEQKWCTHYTDSSQSCADGVECNICGTVIDPLELWTRRS